MKKVTILTPTYNRGYILHKCYKSLVSQTLNDFVWLIVDDGSTDDTKNIVNSFKEEKKIDIKYVYKENGGKHTALNVGINMINTELTFIVDSDDYLLNDSISTIKLISEKYDYKCETLCGFSFLKVHNDRSSSIKLPRNEFVDTYTRCRIIGNIPGDMAEVFYTNVLKQYPFPKFKNEKFISEDIVWIRMATKYKMVFVNKPIYVFEYLEDGLTSNDKQMKFSSPFGSMMRGKVLMENHCGLKSYLKGAIIYNCYKLELLQGMEIPNDLKFSSVGDKIVLKITRILGKYFNRHWKNGSKTKRKK